ncbi:MAG: Nif3-like dinuclear metal center hexameric protein [Clostridiaceae bacterium]|nr:Nif3-like dinuclear metal center hexameric protein [Clostridiaceae bacterium]
MKIWEILEKADAYCPPAWAEDWDNCGLQIGDVERETEGVLVCLDVDAYAVSDAIVNRCGLIVSHHPLLFDPVRAIDEATPAGRLIARILRERLTVFSMHTNLDRIRGGVSDQLAWRMGLEPGAPIAPYPPAEEGGDPAQPAGFGRICIPGPGLRMLDLESRARGLPGADGFFRNYRTDGPATRIAVMGGSFPDEHLDDLVRLGCDALVTGEIGYHDSQTLGWRGIRVLAIGHAVSESPVLEPLAHFFSSTIPEVRWTVHQGGWDICPEVRCDV